MRTDRISAVTVAVTATPACDGIVSRICVGYTAMAEEIAPAHLARLLDEFLQHTD